jgi:hypothetical protein
MRTSTPQQHQWTDRLETFREHILKIPKPTPSDNGILRSGLLLFSTPSANIDFVTFLDGRYIVKDYERSSLICFYQIKTRARGLVV